MVAAAAAACWLPRLADHLPVQTSPVAKAGEYHGEAPGGPMVKLVADKANTLQITSGDALRQLGIQTSTVQRSPPPRPLRLPGSLFLDPNRIVHVHTRFPGEVVTLGSTRDDGGERPLRFGDQVQKGDLLATIWSKEIGEKKSEYVEALSRLDAANAVLAKLESLTRGIVAERQIIDARRDVESAQIAVTRAERTLRSWRLVDAEIDAVKREYTVVQQRKGAVDKDVERRWAEVEVRAPLTGVILEKNFNVGDMVDIQDDLFKVADLTRLQVTANVYEEDLWAVRALPAESRRWTIDLKSDPTDNAIEGKFDLIGSVIDPAQRTGVLIGSLDNRDRQFAVGQFVTATIGLPADASLVAIPESALIEEGDNSSVMVQVDAQGLTFARRQVRVVRRGTGVVLIESAPAGGSESHLVGEVLVISGALGLAGELEKLQAESR